MSSLLKHVGIALTKGNSSTVQAGGAPKAVSNQRLIACAFIWTTIILLIKIFLVYWGWNYLGPRVFPEHYKPLTFADSAAMVILVQALFN